MKLFTTIITGLALVLVVFSYVSCSKSYTDRVAATNGDFSNAALVQVFDATVNSSRTYVYVDGTTVTGVALAYGSVYPSTAYAFSVKAGLRSFLIKDTLSTSTQAQLAFAENFDAASNYTIFMYDTTPTAKQKTIKNIIVIPSDTTARVKFVNFIHNSASVPAVDVFSVKRNQNVFTNVSKTEATDYLPYASSLSDTLLVRETGTMNQLAALNGFNPTRKRSYTLIYRGSHKGTRVLSSFPNN